MDICFEIISNEMNAVKKLGYRIKPGTTYSDDHERIGITDTTSNRWQNMVDSFYDMTDTCLCRGSDGNMYAVDFYYADNLPYIWQEVEKMS